MLRILVDADNVLPSRVQPVLDLAHRVTRTRITASGSGAALLRVEWPAGTELIAQTGWQRADLALAAAYRPTADPLLLITGDGDFGLLAARHPGPVLVVSGAASARLREGTTVIDPAADGVGAIADWIATYAS